MQYVKRYLLTPNCSVETLAYQMAERPVAGSGIGKGAEEIVCVEFEQISVHDGHDSTLFR
jgi:hypothetical protein